MPGLHSTFELESMMADVESQLVERKRSTNDLRAIRRTICAFANDLPGLGKPGVILLGVEDDGTCAGLEVTDELLLKLANLRDDGNLQPLPSLTIEKRTLSACTVVLILVEPSLYPPMRYSGRVFVRVGPSARQATPADEQRLTERRQAGHRPFDHRLAPDSSLADLDLDYAKTQYIPRAVAQDVIEQNQRPLTSSCFPCAWSGTTRQHGVPCLGSGKTRRAGFLVHTCSLCASMEQDSPTRSLTRSDSLGGSATCCIASMKS